MTVDFKSTPLEPLALQARVVQFSRDGQTPGAVCASCGRRRRVPLAAAAARGRAY